jgi:hypothetical protein
MLTTEQKCVSAQRKLVVVEWRPCEKGASLKGFVTLRLPSGLVLHDLTYHHRQDGATWVLVGNDNGAFRQRQRAHACVPSSRMRAYQFCFLFAVSSIARQLL